MPDTTFLPPRWHTRQDHDEVSQEGFHTPHSLQWGVHEKPGLERFQVRLTQMERRGHHYTVLLDFGDDPGFLRFLRQQLPRILSLAALDEGERILLPGDCRMRLRAELRHRGVRVKG